MFFIDVKDMICRRLNHFIPLSKQNSLEYVNNLCKICHLHTIAVFIKYIQCDPRYKCITHRILLIKKSRICTRLTCIPRSPFIYNHAYFFQRIIFIHNLTMSANKFIHIHRLIQCLIPDIFIKLR